MKSRTRSVLLCASLCAWLTATAVGVGQERPSANAFGGPLAGPALSDVPFSADAVTSVRLSFPNGSRLEQRTTARYYRDRQGRVRIENETPGSSQRPTIAERHIRTIVDEHPGDNWVNTLDSMTQTARILARSFVGLGAGGGAWAFTVPIGGARFLTFHRIQDLKAGRAWDLGDDAFDEESLGIDRMAGVDVIGHRLSMTIPVGHIGNDRPIEIVDEHWDSPELGIVIGSRYSDSRYGTIEYQVTNIGRREPAADLFTVPADYSIDRTSSNQDGWLTLVFPNGYQSTPRRGGVSR